MFNSVMVSDESGIDYHRYTLTNWSVWIQTGNSGSRHGWPAFFDFIRWCNILLFFVYL